MKVILHLQAHRQSYLLRLAAVPCLLAVTVLAVITNAAAETILIDDFSNPNLDGWTHVDSSIGKSWGPGVVDASDGTLLLTPPRKFQAMQMDAVFTFSDGTNQPTRSFLKAFFALRFV